MEMAKKTSSNDKEMFSVKQSSENERQLDQHERRAPQKTAPRSAVRVEQRLLRFTIVCIKTEETAPH